MSKLLERLGFSENPFANYSAENEPAIDQYFVRPPYYDFIRDRGLGARSALLFGSRGAGKSATRLTFAKEAWPSPDDTRKLPLTVTLDDFSRILSDGPEKADLGRFVAEVGYLVIEAVLLWLATHSEEERTLLLGTLTESQENSIIALVQHFYLTRPEHVRQSSVREPLKLLQQAWHKRARLWFGDRWDSIAGLVAALAQGLGNKWAGTSVNVEAGLSSLLKADRLTWSETHFARELLSRFVDVSRWFGFAGLTILVDKVDETTHTNNSASATAALIYPVLANTQLLEIDGLGWLMFLWSRVAEEYSGDRYRVRLDKIPNATIAWDERFLAELTTKRLVHFSQKKITTFSAICDPSVPSQSALDEAVRISMKSPRELIRILDTIVREHDEEFANVDDSPLLLQPSIDRALDKYANDAVTRSFEPLHLQQLARLRMTTFVNKDVQQVFRINDQSARNRIRGWVDAGIVHQSGTRQAEGGSGGKPSNEYAISDFRLRRLLARDLLPKPEFETDTEGGEEGGLPD